MTGVMMSLLAFVEKTPEPDILRDKIAFAADFFAHDLPRASDFRAA